jgi:hypothetical protein
MISPAASGVGLFSYGSCVAGQAIVLIRLESQPSSDGFPEGLLDQPFYGWVQHRPTPTSSPFQRASDSVSSCCTNEKDAEAPFRNLALCRPGLTTLRESRVNAAQYSNRRSELF